MRFCLMIEGQEGVAWRHWQALADACERLGFEGLFRSDHYFSAQGVAGRGATDAWTLLGALAATTTRIRLGTLVSPATFRAPALLAKAATTVDEISGGRVEIGMGAGWWTEEHSQFGFPFPSAPERFSILEEQLEIVHGLLTEDMFTFRGDHHTLEDAQLLPKGVQRPHPPIIVGGDGGPRLARLVSRWADEFNTVGGDPQEVREKFARVRGQLDADGRDQASLTTSMMTWCYVGEDEDDYRTRVRSAQQRSMRAAKFDDELEQLEKDNIVGSPERAAERLSQYAAAGVQRIMLNHELVDDIEMLELLADRVFPLVEG